MANPVVRVLTETEKSLKACSPERFLELIRPDVEPLLKSQLKSVPEDQTVALVASVRAVAETDVEWLGRLIKTGVDQENYARSYNQVKDRLAMIEADSSGKAAREDVESAQSLRQPGTGSSLPTELPPASRLLQLLVVMVRAGLLQHMEEWYWKNWCDANQIGLKDFCNSLSGSDTRIKLRSSRPWWRFW